MPAQRRLHDEGHEADAGVIDREETEQRIAAAAERACRLSPEGIVGQRRAGRPECHERREIAQVCDL
jgi:hypothetical protein